MMFRELVLPALLVSAGLFAPATSGADTPAPAAATVVIAGDAQLTLTADAQHVEIHAGALHLVGDTRADKRYYHRGKGGAAFVEVKSDADGFKLRTPDSKLLWKIKLGADKIKVSDNEQNANAWEIKTGHPDKAKIVDGAGKEVGEVKFAAKIKLKDAAGGERFVVESGAKSAAYGALLLTNVPEEYRPVIVAELLVRGR
ncbi:MAG: hypothetical protein ABI846_08950 [Rudaea sp.]